MNLLWFENLLLMRLWVWNAYLVLLWNRALAYPRALLPSGGPLSREFWQLTTPLSRGRVQVDSRIFPQIQTKWQFGLTPSAFAPMYLWRWIQCTVLTRPRRSTIQQLQSTRRKVKKEGSLMQMTERRCLMTLPSVLIPWKYLTQNSIKSTLDKKLPLM